MNIFKNIAKKGVIAILCLPVRQITLLILLHIPLMIYPEIFYGLSSILYIVLFWVAFSIISTHTNIYFFDGRFLRSFNLYRLVFDLKFEEKNSIDLSALKKVKNLNHVNMKQSIYKQTGLYKFQIKLSQLVFGF